jgi:DNA-binding NarL/FixJ family response regulator
MTAGTREVCEGRRGRRTRLRGSGGGLERRLGNRLLRIFSPARREGQEPRQKEIRVFLCDDVGDVRLLTRVGLEEDGDLRVVGEADTGPEALAAIAEVRPDVVLVDLSMPGMDGFELIPLIRQAAPNVGILVFSGFGRHRMESGALEVGADAYLEKGESFERLREVTREVAGRRPSGQAEDES